MPDEWVVQCTLRTLRQSAAIDSPPWSENWTYTVGWLDVRPGLKEGATITLVGDERIWHVHMMSRPVLKQQILKWAPR